MRCKAILCVLVIILTGWGCSSGGNQKKENPKEHDLPSVEYQAPPSYPVPRPTEGPAPTTLPQPKHVEIDADSYEDGLTDGDAAAEEDRLAGKPLMQIGEDEGEDEDYDEGYDDGYEE